MNQTACKYHVESQQIRIWKKNFSKALDNVDSAKDCEQNNLLKWTSKYQIVDGCRKDGFSIDTINKIRLY
jgi:hypothetical protein